MRKWLLISLIFVSLILVIGVSGCQTNQSSTENDTNTIPSNLKQAVGLNGIIKVGNLSFQLTDVTLMKWATPKWVEDKDWTQKQYTLYWTLDVTNNGDKIENVSDCGILLFEDGSQYNFDVTLDDADVDIDITGQCTYYAMVPGAKVTMYSTFYFTNKSDGLAYCFWSRTPLVWQDVPGSKITYFSQQNAGLVKYVVDKSEILNDSEPYTPYVFSMNESMQEVGYPKVKHLIAFEDRFNYYQNTYC
jgi:hypothetical protein